MSDRDVRSNRVTQNSKFSAAESLPQPRKWRRGFFDLTLTGTRARALFDMRASSLCFFAAAIAALVLACAMPLAAAGQPGLLGNFIRSMNESSYTRPLQVKLCSIFAVGLSKRACWVPRGHQ
jgi:hypothetical protein